MLDAELDMGVWGYEADVGGAYILHVDITCSDPDFCGALHSESSFSAKAQPFELSINFLDRAEYQLQHV